MKTIGVMLLALAFSLAMVAAYADHPYSSDRDDGQSYYNERRTTDRDGYQQSAHPYQSRPPGDSWDYGYQSVPPYPNDPGWSGRDSGDARDYRWAFPYGSDWRWPWPPDRYAYERGEYRGGPPYGKAYGYYRDRDRDGDHDGYRDRDRDVAGVLRLGDGRSGLTIIVRP